MAEFAEFLGLGSPTTYYRYENGRVPKPDILGQIAAKLGISTSDLLQTPPHEKPTVTGKRASLMMFPLLHRSSWTSSPGQDHPKSSG